ncbi:MAG: flagellar export chaperone FlgN [Synergistaceae bacterium]|nr:flagellar export chaperone FlgN [Synergistaceae bacterium]
MRSEVQDLIDAVLDEADFIDELVDVVREQREAVKARDATGVDDLLKETREIFFDIETQESLRDDLAKKLAARLGGEPRANSLSALMEEDERALFNGAVDRLTQSIFVLKSEMMILSGLIDQNEKYTSMLLSEWRRLMGDVSQAGATDFRG